MFQYHFIYRNKRRARFDRGALACLPLLLTQYPSSKSISNLLGELIPLNLGFYEDGEENRLETSPYPVSQPSGSELIGRNFISERSSALS